MKFKKPSNTICLVVVILLLFILCCGAFVYSQINDLTAPLEGERIYITGEVLVESTYVNFEVIEQSKGYTIFRDNQTDILYLEFKRNGYSSAITVLLNTDGTPKTYSQFVGG